MYKLTIASLFVSILTLSYAQAQRNRFTEFLLRSKKFDPFGNLPKSQFYSPNEQDETPFSMPDLHGPLNFLAPPFPIISRMSSPRNKVPLPPAMLAMSTISLPKLTPIMKMAVIRGKQTSFYRFNTICNRIYIRNIYCIKHCIVFTKQVEVVVVAGDVRPKLTFSFLLAHRFFFFK